MNNDIIVSTLPIKPQEKASIGRITAPLVAEFLSKKLDCKFTFSTNTLHSYENKKACLDNYLQSVSDIGIHYDSLYIDSERTNKFLENIIELIEKGIIVKKTGTTLRCECGRVDISKKGIRNYDGASLYIKEGEKYLCKECHTECKEYEEEGLYFKLDEKIDDRIKIFPTYLKKNISQFSETIRGTELLISKTRETGYKIENFNIDIDFLWMNFVTDFPEQKQILVACNREIFKMYLLNYINKHISDKDITFVAHPFIKKPEGMNLKELMNRYDELYRKLSILYTIRWRNKECQYNSNVMEQIAKLGGVKREILFDIISNNDYEQEFDLECYLENLFYRKINLQNDMKKIKKLVNKNDIICM